MSILRIIIATSCIAMLSIFSARAAIITQTVSNVDWNTAMWGVPAAAPTTGNQYITDLSTGATTRILATSNFGGDGLELVYGTQLLSKVQTGIATINGNLTLNGGTLHNGTTGTTASTHVLTLNVANLVVSATSTIGLSGGGNGIIINGPLTGLGNLYLGNQGAGGMDDYITINSIGSYNGALFLGQYATGSILSNSGDLTIDFGSGSYAFGNSLTVSNSAVLKVNNGQTLTFNSGDLIDGVTAISAGTYTANTISSSFTGTGTIVVVPEPSMALLGALGALLLLRRCRVDQSA